MPTKIEWCTETWSPITGCSPISEGCQNCYARRMSYRLKGRFGYPKTDPFQITFHPDRLEQPLKWKKPRMIFVCSMGDLFHEDVPDEWIQEIWQICRNSFHTFIWLTKRPQRALEWSLKTERTWTPNIWLGVTCENQQRADERIPILLQTPAAKRFVSIEPMLEPIDLDKTCPGKPVNDGWCWRSDLDWIICGSETGPGARYMNPDWARSIKDQCKDAGVPFFMKKMSNKEPIPDDLMIRQYPL